MSPPRLVTVCFAVKEEARFFKPRPEPDRHVRTLVTGMGKVNAENAIRKLLSALRPELVLTCGFAGGLNPELAAGSVIFEIDDADAHLRPVLLKVGARPATFHCAAQVATTAAEKRDLRQATGTDAVEMESGVIREICRAAGIPGGTVRVILDTANEDLPLDFNKLMTRDQRMDYWKLGMAIMKSPGKIQGLLQLQKKGNAAAQKLAMVLNEVLLK